MPTLTLNGSEAWRGLAGKPDRQWSDIAGRFADDVFTVTHAPKFALEMGSRFFCLGSCFARNIEEHLIYRGADVLSKRVVSPAEEWPYRTNGFLNKFTTRSMLQEIRWLDSPPDDPAALLTETAAGWRDLQLAPELGTCSLERALERRAYLAQDYFPRLASADVLLMTLGLNEVWFDSANDVYLNAPPPLWNVRREPERYTVKVTDVADNLDALLELRDRLKRLNPAMRIIVTVSPVPMGATFSGCDVAIANTRSKSTLRCAAEAFCAAHDDVDYFPSYEMVTLSPRTEAYAADCLHVTDKVVSRVMAAFLKLYCQTDAEPPDGFVEWLYLDANPDVEAAVRLGHFVSGFEHWTLHGRGEGRLLRSAEINTGAQGAGIG